MTKIKALTIAVVVLMLLNIGIIAFLFFSKPNKINGMARQRDGEPKHIIMQKLNFSEAQINNYEKLIETHRLAITKAEQEMNDARQMLFNNLNTTVDSFLVNNLTLTIANKQQQIEIIHYNHFKEIKELCAPNQLPLFYNLSKELSQLFNKKRPRD